LGAAGHTHYTRVPRDPTWHAAPVNRPECLAMVRQAGGESHSFNFFPTWIASQCPTLVAGGEDDPIHPIESQVDIAAALRRIWCGSNGSLIAGTLA